MIDAVDFAVEAAVGETIRAALTPFLPHIENVYPTGYALMTGKTKAAGMDWMLYFRHPILRQWKGGRYPKEVREELAATLYKLSLVTSKAHWDHFNKPQ